MTSIAQFYDINEDPFIVIGRKIIDSLKLEVGTVYKDRPNDKPGAIACDSYYLYFNTSGFNDVYFDFLIKAFADKKECHPPVKIRRGIKKYVTTFYKCNFRIVDKKLKSEFWDKEETLKETTLLKNFLNEYLIQYFYDYLSF